MSRSPWSRSVVLGALFSWVAIAATIIAVGMSPVLAALAASIVVFDLLYYRREADGAPVVCSG